MMGGALTPAQFERFARRRLSAELRVQLAERQVPGVPKRFDFVSPDDVEAEVERLLGLGAARVEQWPYPPEVTFVVLRDPSGNEFCVTEVVEL